ncbi:MAG: DUF2796 domain-containing protein [Bdellovibrionaceae bacterium]|nr:DUF2796 domain-containing protein [Pseudobdellovibrionaceae bacterium]
MALVTWIQIIFLHVSMAHVHGQGNLNLVIEDNKLVLSVTLPAEDVIGFERAPKSKEEKLVVDRAIARLKDVHSMFEFQKEARCKLLDQAFVSAEAILNSESKTPKQKRHKHKGKSKKNSKSAHQESAHVHKPSSSGHSDIQVSYMLECSSVSDLKQIKVLLFELFPNIQKLKTQLVSEEVQSASVVNAKKPFFILGK